MIAHDKLDHAVYSFAIVALLAPHIGLLAALWVGVAVGIAKEVYDHVVKDRWETGDLVADALGIVLAGLIF